MCLKICTLTIELSCKQLGLVLQNVHFYLLLPVKIYDPYITYHFPIVQSSTNVFTCTAMFIISYRDIPKVHVLIHL